MIGNSVIMELIANGVLWYYESYNHKAACDEINMLVITKKSIGYALSDSPYVIPDNIKIKHLLWRTGKLRTMRFDPDGMIFRMYVGRSFRYAKGFFPQDVGKTIKPILNHNNDKFNLIQAGLAVDENQI